MKAINKFVAFAALLSFPVISFAEGDNGLQLTKTLSTNPDGTYTLTLEAYATGEEVQQTVTETKATDIVLVLDNSGSMDDDITVVKSGSTSLSKLDTDLGADEGFYHIQGSISERSVRYHNGNWQYDEAFVGWTNIAGSRLEGAAIYTTKLKAMKAAAYNFVKSVKANAAESNVTHNVAIVKFASNNSSSTSTVLSLTPISGNTDLSSIRTIINNFSGSGDTSADWAMQLACNILDGCKNNDHAKAVILLTDGVPNHGGNPIDGQVANAAIYYSHIAKSTYKAKVFSIGVFDEDPTGDVLNYMNYVSSNYPDADATPKSGFDPNIGGTSYGKWNGHDISYYFNGTQSRTNCGLTTNSGSKADTKYYANAQDASTLQSIFDSISREVITGGSSTTLGTSAVIKDFITPQFTLPEGAVKDLIKIYTAPCTGAGTPGLIFGARSIAPSTVSVVTATDSKGNAGISVTGFDFCGNWCGYRIASASFSGLKLIIEIPILAVESAEGGANLPTNSSESGVYENKDAKNPTGSFPVPETDLPVTVTIKKTGLAAGDNAVFTIVKTGNIVTPESDCVHFTGDYSTSVILTGNGGELTAKIKLMPAKYKIEELDWSFGYTVSGTSSYEEVIKNEGKVYSFVNVIDEKKPQHAESSATNVFTTSTVKK